MKRLISVLLILLLAACVLGATVLADEGTVISVATAEASQGSEVVVNVTISGNTGFATAMLTLNYDHDILELESLDAGDLVSGMTVVPYAETGKINFTQTSGNTSGDGILCYATFKVLDDAEAGASVVSVTINRMMDKDLVSLGATATAGTVTVTCNHSITAHSATDATCEGSGTTAYWECSKCGKLFSDAAGTTEISAVETIPATGHDWGEWSVTTEATCTSEGEETRICNNDKSHTDTRSISVDAEAHDWGEWAETTAATEAAEGVETRVCKNDASHTDTRATAKLGHNLSKVEAVAATCEATGNIEYYTCSGCGKLFSDAAGTIEIEQADTVVGATGHDWDNGAVTTAATCETDGVKTFTCKNDNTHTKTATITATDHDWGEWAVTTKATCTTEGEETRICNNDKSHTDTRSIAVDADAHDWGEWTETKAATEEAEGSETRTCNNDSSHTETREIPKLDHVHKLDKTEAVAATCEADGNIEYYTCSGCGKLFSDAAGTVEIEQADTVVGATGHDWDDGAVTTAATCETDGVKTFTCKNDKTHTKTATITATDHDWGDWAVTTKATCTTEGEETRICKNDESHTETRSTAVDIEAHDWDEGTVTTAATCETDGVKTYTCKNNDGHIKTATITATGHDWDDGSVTTAATCETDGVKTYTCKNDSSHTKEATITATDHDWGEWTVNTEATCTAEGEETRICKNDENHTETRSISVDADAHDWGEWTETTAATEEAEGSETRTCKNDSSHTETRSIPKLDHIHVLVKTKAVAATCETAGNIEYYTCSGCGKLFSDTAGTVEIEQANTVVSATDHTWDSGTITTAATCEVDGVKTFTCTTDRSHTKTETITATGHDWDDWTVTTEATCTTKGEETRVCKNDENHTESRSISVDEEAHDWGEWVETTAATEDAEGSETRTCKNDSSHTETRSIPTLDHIHVLVKTEAVAATCEAAGNTEYYTCSGCGKLFSDAAGTTEIEKADTVVALLDHEWNEGQITVTATSTADGEITYTCDRCGTTKTESYKIKYDTPTIAYGDVGGQEVETVLSAAILSNAGYDEDNIIYCDITLKISLDNGASYVLATASTMPAEGITVTIPYPEGTTAEDYDYTVVHLLSDGTVETFVPVESEDGLNVTVKSFSPFAVGYKKSAASASQPTDNTNNSNTNNKNTPSGNVPNTGDENNITLWCMILFACATGIVVLVNKGKRKTSYRREH
jgi:hypothetical protein